MSYYSDIKIAMKIEDEKRFLDILRGMGGSNEDIENFDRVQHTTSTGTMVFYEADSIKWYLDCDEIRRVQKAIQTMVDEKIYVHFLRVGEDVGDVEEITSGVPCMYLSRKITKYN